MGPIELGEEIVDSHNKMAEDSGHQNLEVRAENSKDYDELKYKWYMDKYKGLLFLVFL